MQHLKKYIFFFLFFNICFQPSSIIKASDYARAQEKSQISWRSVALGIGTVTTPISTIAGDTIFAIGAAYIIYRDYIQPWQQQIALPEQKIDHHHFNIIPSNHAHQTHQAKEYFSPEIQQLCNEFHIDTSPFNNFQGHALQQDIHKNLITNIHQATKLFKQTRVSEVKQLSIHSIEFAQLSQEYNVGKSVKKALLLSDFSSNLLVCAKTLATTCINMSIGAGEGIAQGIYDTGKSFIHPIETLEHIGTTVETITYHAAKVIYCIALIPDSDLAFIAPDFYEQQCAHFSQQTHDIRISLNNLIDYFKHHSVRDASRKLTSCGIGIFLTGKVLKAVKKTLITTQKTVNAITSHIPESATIIENNAANTPKSIQTSKQMQKNAHNIDQKTTDHIADLIEGTTEHGGFVKDLKHIIERRGEPQYIFKEVFIAPDHPGIIKQFNVTKQYLEHIFSDKHIDNGLHNLGKSQSDIINKVIDKILQLDAHQVLKEGSNPIETIINGHIATIRVEIKNMKVLSINAFKGTSNRKSPHPIRDI